MRFLVHSCLTHLSMLLRDFSGGGLDELQRPTKRRVINSLPSMCEGMR